MKANEAPEKIYVHVKNDKVTNTWNSTWKGVRDVEYTRTDAFIEKAYNWLKNYAFVDDNKNVNLPTLLHDFLKDSRSF